MIPIVSGRAVIKILANRFGFQVARQRGSHVILTKLSLQGKITTVVPDHAELKKGTLLGVLRLARIELEEFLVYYQEK
ncbi:MAG: type II toxin-antitoxin system HicA family toxin [bacterium]